MNAAPLRSAMKCRLTRQGKTPGRRSALACLIFVVCSMLLLLGERARLGSAQAALAAKQNALTQMEQDVQAIETLRQAPHRATDRQRPHDQLVAEIDAARERAGIPQTHVGSIWPEAPRRVERSDYLQLDTRLILEGVSLEQLSGFVTGLRDADSSLFIESLRLTSPRAGEKQWNSEIVLSYLLYGPRSSSGASGG